MIDVFVLKSEGRYLVRPAACVVRVPKTGRKKVWFRNLTAHPVEIALPEVFLGSSLAVAAGKRGSAWVKAKAPGAFPYGVTVLEDAGQKDARGDSAPIIIIDK